MLGLRLHVVRWRGIIRQTAFLSAIILALWGNCSPATQVVSSPPNGLRVASDDGFSAPISRDDESAGKLAYRLSVQPLREGPPQLRELPMGSPHLYSINLQK